jgi:hypothetical protein
LLGSFTYLCSISSSDKPIVTFFLSPLSSALIDLFFLRWLSFSSIKNFIYSENSKLQSFTNFKGNIEDENLSYAPFFCGSIESKRSEADKDYNLTECLKLLEEVALYRKKIKHKSSKETDFNENYEDKKIYDNIFDINRENRKLYYYLKNYYIQFKKTFNFKKEYKPMHKVFSPYLMVDVRSFVEESVLKTTSEFLRTHTFENCNNLHTAHRCDLTNVPSGRVNPNVALLDSQLSQIGSAMNRLVLIAQRCKELGFTLLLDTCNVSPRCVEAVDYITFLLSYRFNKNEFLIFQTYSIESAKDLKRLKSHLSHFNCSGLHWGVVLTEKKKNKPFTYDYMLHNPSVSLRKTESINFFRQALDILIPLDGEKNMKSLAGDLYHDDNAERMITRTSDLTSQMKLIFFVSSISLCKDIYERVSSCHTLIESTTNKEKVRVSKFIFLTLYGLNDLLSLVLRSMVKNNNFTDYVEDKKGVGSSDEFSEKYNPTKSVTPPPEFNIIKLTPIGSVSGRISYIYSLLAENSGLFIDNLDRMTFDVPK